MEVDNDSAFRSVFSVTCNLRIVGDMIFFYLGGFIKVGFSEGHKNWRFFFTII